MKKMTEKEYREELSKRENLAKIELLEIKLLRMKLNSGILPDYVKLSSIPPIEE